MAHLAKLLPAIAIAIVPTLALLATDVRGELETGFNIDPCAAVITWIDSYGNEWRGEPAAPGEGTRIKVHGQSEYYHLAVTLLTSSGGNVGECETPCPDMDGDGVTDCKDSDDDNDLLSDAFEVSHEMNAKAQNQDGDDNDGTPQNPYAGSSLIDGYDLVPLSTDQVTPVTSVIKIRLDAVSYSTTRACDAGDSKPETYLVSPPLFKVPALSKSETLEKPSKWREEYWFAHWSPTQGYYPENPTDEEMLLNFEEALESPNQPDFKTITDDIAAFSSQVTDIELRFDLKTVSDDDVAPNEDDPMSIGGPERSAFLAIDNVAGQDLHWSGSTSCYLDFKIKLFEDVDSDLLACALENLQNGRVPGQTPCNL